MYTLSCAGTEGFLRLLPVYLDHVLFPTLTLAGFRTEVYSVTESGEDNGAVYCEMQGRENSGESRGNLELMRTIYKGHPYAIETGGIMKDIRDSLTIEKIRAYHSNFYRAENLAVIVAGQVDIGEIAKALEPIEKKILERKGKLPPYEKPWQTPVKPLTESKDLKILFPSDEEVSGVAMKLHLVNLSNFVGMRNRLRRLSRTKGNDRVRDAHSLLHPDEVFVRHIRLASSAVVH